MKTFNIYNNDNKAVQAAFDMITAKILINNKQKPQKTFVLTSCLPGEGKTSLAISLAIAIANSGWKALLVDADMRKPTVSKRLNTEAQLGLSDYLAGKIDLSKTVSETNITNLTYLPCGSDYKNPVELLCSVRFQELIDKTQNGFDFVLFDTPALESVMDAAIVASKVEETLLVVEMGTATLKSIKRVKEQLERLNAHIYGVVLNKVPKSDYRRYFGSFDYFFKTERFFKKEYKKRESTSDKSTRNKATL